MSNNITIKNSDSLRNELMVRNLYSLDNQYPIISDNNIDKIVKSVSNIVSSIMPFESNSISDSLLGRLITDKTPLTEIGLACLSKQLEYTIKDNLLSDYTPKINVGTLFDKNDNEKFLSWTDYTISKKSSNSFLGSVKDILKKAVGSESNTKNDLDFDISDQKGDKYSDLEYMANHTGNGQLDLMLSNIKRNRYKLVNIQKSIRLGDRIDKISDFYNSSDNLQTFGHDNVFIEYGDPIRLNNEKINNDSFIWGIDNDKVIAPKDSLLAYTRDNINNNFNNIKNGVGYNVNDKISYNGSNIYESPDNSLFGSTTGLRQHSAKDPYGKFAKAIRFNGNSIYSGNKNSVIYNSVIPKIHPVFTKDSFDKNLMFSIENLADKVYEVETKNGVVGEDADGKYIPLSEVGLFGGRLMWFPPYDISFNETTANKIDETMMVGRGEPIYTYVNSSRTGTLSFKLIIDYPQQLKEMRNNRGGNLTSDEIANFFAFGINLESDNKIINNKNEIKKEKDIKSIIDNSTHVEDLGTLSNNLIIVFKKDAFKSSTSDDINSLFSSYYSDEINRKYFDISIDISNIKIRTDINNEISNLSNLLLFIYKEITDENYDRNFVIIDDSSDTIPVDHSNDINYSYGDDDYYVINVERNNISNKRVIINSDNKKTLDDLNQPVKTSLPFNSFETNLNELTINSTGNDSTSENTLRSAFNSQTPEEFHRRLTFLQQCMRQGDGLNLVDNPRNSAFGRQPFSIIRLGDYIYSKVIFSNLTIDYESKDIIWDLNPEGWGMQPMTANVTLQMFIIGGQSLEGPISALQNAISYNYYANSTFGKRGFYNDGIPTIKNNVETLSPQKITTNK